MEGEEGWGRGRGGRTAVVREGRMVEVRRAKDRKLGEEGEKEGKKEEMRDDSPPKGNGGGNEKYKKRGMDG